MKLIAFYLPQFHEIPENNMWWGKGFTEWTNTKKAEPLFHEHYQPRIPFEQNYYDLTDSSVRNWQAELAKSFGIYGFCYYHYWFKGKLLLETPLQEVLKLSEPDFPFCLSWANEPWTRKWDGSENEVLMPQDYGDENDWQEHFEYLKQVFSDDRYIKVDGKPIFLIYRPQIIPDCDKMLDYWDDLAKKSGWNGMYFIETLNGFPKKKLFKNFQAAVEFEPHYTMALGEADNAWRVMESFEHKSKHVLDYDEVWSNILDRNPILPNTIPGAFVDWDNTARLGQNSTVYEGASPEKWKDYLSKQLIRAREVHNSEFLFINAWNEWAEGAYLEPDMKYGFNYLEAVKDALIQTKNYKL
ncbi:glycoside hydrolase family 99-like domain-containing protein [Bacillus mesophilum]|uniref:glycosyltransferase WbsX family protein n=1 Tax=Bacillus mesophilum TaxID=1071718 RepID=UPI001EFFA6FF|nr:glycoside hydrolase family 99-like domain-containing protein [Bacillus mesophilum]